ncbi:hypothetical protein RHS03_01669, partial [Rhizoctonia solani]
MNNCVPTHFPVKEGGIFSTMDGVSEALAQALKGTIVLNREVPGEGWMNQEFTNAMNRLKLSGLERVTMTKSVKEAQEGHDFKFAFEFETHELEANTLRMKTGYKPSRANLTLFLQAKVVKYNLQRDGEDVPKLNDRDSSVDFLDGYELISRGIAASTWEHSKQYYSTNEAYKRMRDTKLLSSPEEITRELQEDSERDVNAPRRSRRTHYGSQAPVKLPQSMIDYEEGNTSRNPVTNSIRRDRLQAEILQSAIAEAQSQADAFNQANRDTGNKRGFDRYAYGGFIVYSVQQVYFFPINMVETAFRLAVSQEIDIQSKEQLNGFMWDYLRSQDKAKISLMAMINYRPCVASSSWELTPTDAQIKRLKSLEESRNHKNPKRSMNAGRVNSSDQDRVLRSSSREREAKDSTSRKSLKERQGMRRDAKEKVFSEDRRRDLEDSQDSNLNWQIEENVLNIFMAMEHKSAVTPYSCYSFLAPISPSTSTIKL